MKKLVALIVPVLMFIFVACGSTDSTTASPSTEPDKSISGVMQVQEILDIAATVPLSDDGWTVDKESDIYKKYIDKTITITGKVSIADVDAGEMELTATGEDGLSVSVLVCRLKRLIHMQPITHSGIKRK